MAANNYEEALRRVLVHEGGYTSHPSDPGGPTNFGITIHDYRKYVKSNASAADVKAMPIAEAKAIYRSKYWNAMRCDELGPGVDYAVFDYGVNSGVGRAGKVLRRILDLSDATSAITDEVIRAAATKKPGDLCIAICDERLRFLKSLKTWPVFGPGWGRRVAEVRGASVAMARNSAASAASAQSPGKGWIAASPAMRKTATGAVIAAGTAATSAIVQAGGLWTASFAAAVTVLIAVAAWFAFGRWQEKRQES